MNIATTKDLGRIIRQKRIDDGLTLEQAAGVCGVSYAFRLLWKMARKQFSATKYNK